MERGRSWCSQEMKTACCRGYCQHSPTCPSLLCTCSLVQLYTHCLSRWLAAYPQPVKARIQKADSSSPGLGSPAPLGGSPVAKLSRLQGSFVPGRDAGYPSATLHFSVLPRTVSPRKLQLNPQSQDLLQGNPYPNVLTQLSVEGEGRVPD